MNFADSEIVASILNGNGFTASTTYADADLVLINTCSIREKAEQTIRSRLHIFRQAKAVQSRSADRRAGLYGGKTEIKISGRRKTGRSGGGTRCIPYTSGAD